MARPKPQYITGSFTKLSLGEQIARSADGDVILFPADPQDSQVSLRLGTAYAFRMGVQISCETLSCLLPGRGVDETFRAIKITVLHNPRAQEYIAKYGKAKGYLTGETPDEINGLTPEDQWNISDEARSAGEPPVELQPVIKRGRGRPRKNPLPDTAQLPLDQPADQPANDLSKED